MDAGPIVVIQIVHLVTPPAITADGGAGIPPYRWFVSALRFTPSQIPVRARLGEDAGYDTAREAWAVVGDVVAAMGETR